MRLRDRDGVGALYRREGGAYGPAVVGDGSVNITHHGAAENNATVQTQGSYLIDGADGGWSGQVRFDVDDTLIPHGGGVDATRTSRVSVRRSGRRRRGGAAARRAPVAAAEVGRDRVALGAWTSRSVAGRDALLGGRRRGRRRRARPRRGQRGWRTSATALRKTEQEAARPRGVAVLELGRTSSTSRGRAEQREAGKFSFRG